MFLTHPAWLFLASGSWFAQIFAVDGSAYAGSFIQTSDGGYLIGGEIEDSYVTNPDLFLVKLSAGASLEWAIIYEAPCGGLLSLIQTKDGGYAIAGSARYYRDAGPRCLLIKLRADGSVEWARSYGDHLHDEAISVIQTKDGGYLLVGNTKSFGTGERDILVIKTDPKGTVSWAKTYGGHGEDRAYSAIRTDDGYVLAGTTDGFGSGGEDVLVMKISTAGSLKWAYAYGGGGDDVAASLVQTANKDYCLAGWTDSFVPDDDRDILVIRLKPDGSLRWANRVGLGENWEDASSLAQSNDKTIVLAGTIQIPRGNENDFLAVKLSESGGLAWARIYRNNDRRDLASSVVQANDGSFVFSGTTIPFAPDHPGLFVLKMSPEGKGLDCLSDYSPEVANVDLSVSRLSLSVQDCSLITDSLGQETRMPDFIKPKNFCE